MSKNKTFFTLWVAVIVLLMVSMPNGYASVYLDPGLCSLIIQVVIACLEFKKRTNQHNDNELFQNNPIQNTNFKKR